MPIVLGTDKNKKITEQTLLNETKESKVGSGQSINHLRLILLPTIMNRNIFNPKRSS